MMSYEEEDQQDIELYNSDGSLDLDTFADIYNASVVMISDLVTFLEEEGYTEEDFKKWRIEYHKRTMH
jgi:hypothetical protein